MKKNLFKFLVLAVLATFVTFTACKDYDDDINKLEGQISNLKTELPAKMDAVKTELTAAIDAKIKTVTDEITALKSKLAELEKNSATQADLDAVKKEILEKTVAKDVYEAFVKKVEKELADLKADLAKAATKEELEAYKVEVTGKFAEMQGKVDALDVRVTSLETALAQLKTLHEKDVNTLIQKIADLKAELDPRITTLESILKVKDGKSEVIDDIYAKLADQLAKIEANATEIAAVKADLAEKYAELVAADEELQRQISQNATDIAAIKGRLDTVEDAIDKLKDRMDKAETAIQLNISNILTLSRQLKGLTFIPTRGLPAEKTMKLYYFAGDYSANHIIMYRVNPSNAKLGRDFTVESLNYQVTTRSASDGVADGSELVSVQINGEVTQEGDIIYVPVHVQGPEACEVYGNHDWWCNQFYTLCASCGDWASLSPENFPPYVVKTVEDPEVDYGCSWEGGPMIARTSTNGEGQEFNHNKGLSLVITALTNSVEDKTKPTKVYVKSSEMVNTQLIPTQIKLAESKGKGNEIVDENLTARLLRFTLEDAAEWANMNENTLPNDNKNWNVLAWSGNQGEGGVWTPGKIDLNKYVSSFFYPQDGGDLSRRNTMPYDPHRYLWKEFGKSFGEPYTDKPHYARPVYEFEQMIYEDTNHNIVIGPQGGEGVTHSYASIEGSMLTVFNTPEAIQGVRNKKLIIQVTQVNSECDERQPVGYLVIKYTDSPEGIWPDANYTIDLAGFPYYHKECNQAINGARVIPMNYTDGDQGTTFTHKNALLELFTADRFMSPINAPASYGLSGQINPGDVNVILAGNLQLNGIGEHNMGNIYNIQRRDASVVPGSVKFKAADYNHVNDAENEADTGVTAEDAFRHVMIRYEYANHSYIVYVDDHAPAGDYEITYLLENKENNTQHGNRLFLTFKFKVALREITVEHDKNTVNWQEDNKTIRVQHTRIHNTIVPDDDADFSLFRSDEGYRVDLKQAFILKDGTVDMATQTLPAVGGVNAGNVPGYRPKFEFIQDAKIKAAGFTYVRDDDNYLTRIELNGQLAARIENDPADRFNYLYITYSKEGDLLYNYLMQDMLSNNDLTKHNVWTKWGKTELTLKDDMERLLPVRMVTDINANCAGEDYLFPNGNYYYIDDFNIKFERALRWAFTTVELTDDQHIQAFVFDFETKAVNAQDESKSVYRGLFDHAYYGANPPAGQVDHGYGNLVHPRWNNLQLFTPWTFTNPFAQAIFYGVETRTGYISSQKFPPMMFTDPNPHHLTIANPLGIGGVNIDGDYTGLDYTKVQVSTDGGNTWKPADQDYFVLAHGRRYFNVITVTGPITGKVYRAAIWQGDQTAITSPIYFRVPVVNQSAINNGLAPEGDTNNYWMTFRKGFAKVKGYAVFKINPRQ